jgi:hypothetical protein
MNEKRSSRRELLKAMSAVGFFLPLAIRRTHAAEAAPLVSADDPTAKALKYVGDASKAPDAKPGSKCGNCSLYQGAGGSAEGGCLLFPGKSVMATGWCSSWTPKA